MRSVPWVLAGLLGVGLFLAVVWVGCGAFLRNNEAYERGLATALADSTVQALLGPPVAEGWFLNGTIEGDGAAARGSWSTRVRGERRGGTLTIHGFKRASRWGVVGLTLTVGDSVYTYVQGVGFVPEDAEAIPAYDVL